MGRERCDVTRYRDVRRPKDEDDRVHLRQLAGHMLARTMETGWRYKLACLVAAVAYARRSNERLQP
jgi:hypothetical protein